MRGFSPKKGLVALGAIGAFAVFGSWSCQNPSATAPQGQQTGINVLFQASLLVFDPEDADWDDLDEFSYLVLDKNGNIKELSRNDANNNHNLSNVISCKNGNAILEDQEDYFLFNSRDLSIIFKGSADSAETHGIFNSNNEPVGVASADQVDGELLVVFCNGDYVATNECPNCQIGNVTPTSVSFYSRDEVFSVTVPSSLASQAVYENPQGLLKRASTSKPLTNNFVAPVVSERYTIYPEVSGLAPEITGFAIVDNVTGDIDTVTLNLPFNVGGAITWRLGVHTASGVTVFGIGNSALGKILLAKYDGNQFNEIARLNLPGGVSFRDHNFDGNGIFYYIRSDQPGDIIHIDTLGNSGSDSIAPASFSMVFHCVPPATCRQWILPTTDGVLLSDGTNFYTYQPGTGLTNLTAPDDEPAKRCTREVFDQRKPTMTCYDKSAGANEVAYLPSIDPNTWVLANPDGIDVDNNLRGYINHPTFPSDRVNYGSTGQHFYVADQLGTWYRCQIGTTSCSSLQNITVFDSAFAPASLFFTPPFLEHNSITPPPTINTGTGFIARVDLINDQRDVFKWSHGWWRFSWDGTILADIVQQPNSQCGQAGMGDIIVTEKLGSGRYNQIKVSSIPDDSSQTPVEMQYQCPHSIIHVWEQ